MVADICMSLLRLFGTLGMWLLFAFMLASGIVYVSKLLQ